jgi:hypothetical protein
VFSLTPPSSPGGFWTEEVLCSFLGSPDTWCPTNILVTGSGGVLYGTSDHDGSFAATSCGEVFR